MTWSVLLALLFGQALAILVLQHRRDERQRSRKGVEAVQEAQRKGSYRARLQFPHVDLSRCMGSGTCIQACPEEGVLALIHDQAAVVNGARCISCGNCARECPVDAITLTLGDVSDRDDLPAITNEWESTKVPGVFLGGEVTGQALIRTAIVHGTTIADVVADRVKGPRDSASQVQVQVGVAASSLGRSWREGGGGAATATRPGEKRSSGTRTTHPKKGALLDLCVVGAGPAGLACSLQAKARGLDFVTLEQEEIGGTVAKYPRRKLVMTQPVDLPLHGRLSKSSYRKEELMELWEQVVREHDLPVRTGEEFQGIEPQADGTLKVKTSGGMLHARNVCLSLGRRGTPRKLGVAGEELPKVAYSLVDAEAYQGRRLLVVGGGDSAIEAALSLTEQPGNQVTLSYRKGEFFRIKSRNEQAVQAAMGDQRLEVVFNSQVTRIDQEEVTLSVKEGETAVERALPNDEVFVMVGGIPPFRLLEQSGVSFDASERPPEAPLVERGTGLRRALKTTLLITAVTLAWLLLFGDYYQLDPAVRFDSHHHEALRPSGLLGLTCGIGAALAILVNLFYLVRRSSLGRRIPGSLKAWMSSHVVTGILSLLLVLVHAAMAPADTVGGYAFWALVVIVAAGAVGRYIYAFVPRAANGQEQTLARMRQQLSDAADQWDSEKSDLGQRVRARVEELVAHVQWDGNLLRRVFGLHAGQWRLEKALAGLRIEARREGVQPEQIDRVVALARESHRTAFMAAHYEDLRALIASWRYLHRWVGLLMVLLMGWHIWAALRYGALLN